MGSVGLFGFATGRQWRKIEAEQGKFAIATLERLRKMRRPRANWQTGGPIGTSRKVSPHIGQQMNTVANVQSGAICINQVLAYELYFH
jgi:hypothetical protein